MKAELWNLVMLDSVPWSDEAAVSRVLLLDCLTMCFFFTAYRPVKDAAAELTVKMYGLLTAKREKQSTERCLV